MSDSHNSCKLFDCRVHPRSTAIIRSTHFQLIQIRFTSTDFYFYCHDMFRFHFSHVNIFHLLWKNTIFHFIHSISNISILLFAVSCRIFIVLEDRRLCMHLLTPYFMLSQYARHQMLFLFTDTSVVWMVLLAERDPKPNQWWMNYIECWKPNKRNVGTTKWKI